MKKSIIIAIIINVALRSWQLAAQPVHEFSVYSGGGLSTLGYKLSHGDRSGALGGEFGLGYTCILPQRGVTGIVGIYTGIGIGLYNAVAKTEMELETSKFADGGTLIDNEGHTLIIKTTLSSYDEKQKTVFLNIPLMAQYQIAPFYGMLGFKLGVPLVGKYSSTSAKLTNKGYYPQFNNTLETQKFAGYGEFPGRTSDGDFHLDVTVMLSLDAGYKLKINDNFSLYISAYLDYGLNNLTKGKHLPFFDYNITAPADFSTNSVLSSLTEKANIMAIGVKLRIGISM